jgi:hypothetical protein
MTQQADPGHSGSKLRGTGEIMQVERWKSHVLVLRLFDRK